jgi:dephospho-CoA kinase
MLKVGLTGNIGSGKTLVAGIFKTLSIPVFDADIEARAVLSTQEVRGDLHVLFGEQIFDQEAINRKALAEIVFKDKEKLKQLNAIIHPKVRQRLGKWITEQHKAPYILYEAAILIETGYYKQLDKTIVVTAEQELRITRVMQRDQVSRQMVEQRMASQWDEQRKAAAADFIITNNQNDQLIPQVLKIHNILTAGK